LTAFQVPWQSCGVPTPAQETHVNDLERYFSQNTGRVLHKWKHYFDIYDRHFARYRDTEAHVLEFGVAEGGSLGMWKYYFGPRARIYGVDIHPGCKSLEEDRIEIFIGDQADRRFLRSVAAAVPKIDILIDDGGHSMKQQIRTFEELFPHIDANGLYVCEDTHTSYWKQWGGGYKRRGTFIEYSKNFIDDVHAWHSRQRQFSASELTRSVYGLHYYDSVLVIEKRPIEPPSHLKTGTSQRLPARSPTSASKRLKLWLRRK
jgi:hypothetical protein